MHCPVAGRRAGHALRPISAAVIAWGIHATPGFPQDRPDVRSDDIVISATRVEQRSFDLPVAIDSVSGTVMREAQLEANVSETLPRAPGTYVQNRQAYSQEQQISIRGFGARSGFGTRGVRLFVDGVPASTPDGQGGTANFDFSSAQRIEVLRGPFSALYGNHSGGVVQIFTEDGPPDPTVTGSFTAGSFDTQRYGLKFGSQIDRVNLMASGSYLTTQGYRDRSSSTRQLFNAKVGARLSDTASLTVTANYLDQPEDLDPLTLNAQQVAANRRQARPESYTFNTRRSLDNRQMGVVYENQLTPADTLRLVGYGGERNNIGFLALAGTLPLSSGGVSQLSRDYMGIGARWTRKTELFAGQPLTFTLGAEYDLAEENRKGYVNQNGNIGALRRSEDNKVDSVGGYGQVEWQPLQRLSVFGGLRYTEVSFRSTDYYIVGVNPDDSGTAKFSAWTPVAGALFRATETLNLYANAGRSFETPTFIELAYRNTGSGLNFDLRPALSDHYEVGAKTFLGPNTRVNAALFHVDTSDEIVVDTTVGGRTTYKNAGGTKRQGLELSVDSDLGHGFFVYGAYTYLKAEYTDSFTGGGATPVTVAAGSQLPGVPQSFLFLDLVWRHAASGFYVGMENRLSSRIYANDTNTAFADGYQVSDLRVGVNRRIDRFTVQVFARMNNMFDELFISGLAVNDSGGYFYAPAAERNFLAGVSASMRF